MKIEDFLKKHQESTKKKNINFLIKKWIAKKQTDDFLGTEIMSGIVLADIIKDGSIEGYIDRETYLGFRALMGEKADTVEKIRDIIIKNFEKGNDSVVGLLGKIQGQVGENVFIREVGGLATLAESGSQEGWDVKYHEQFIQVKTLEDANQVMAKIHEVNEKILNGKIEGVSQIDFAVNSDIYNEVVHKVHQEGLSNHIYDIGKTHDEIRSALEGKFNLMSSVSPLENFFKKLFGNVAVAGTFHAISNSFLVYKGAKEKRRAIEDTIYSTGISAGGFMGSMGAHTLAVKTTSIVNLKLAGILLGPLGMAVSFGAGMASRGFLRRITMRRETVGYLVRDLNRNYLLIEKIQTINPKKAS